MFMECILSFLKYLEFEKRYSKRTVESYHIDLVQFCDFCTSKANIEDITKVEPFSVRDWIVFLLDSGISNRSVNRKLSALNSLFRYLQRMEMVVSNPLSKIDSLKIKKRLPVFVSETKMGQLLDDVLCGTEFTDLRSMLILDMFYLTGIRLSELINIKEKDIDFSGSTIKVLGKRNKERIIPVTKELLQNCNKYLQVRNQEVPIKCEFLFVTHKGEKLYPKLVYRTVKNALTSVTTMEKRSPHVLRHTFATHMLNNGAGINAIKELLGHENLAATQIYTHNSFEKLKKIYKQAHPRA